MGQGVKARRDDQLRFGRRAYLRPDFFTKAQALPEVLQLINAWRAEWRELARQHVFRALT